MIISQLRFLEDPMWAERKNFLSGRTEPPRIIGIDPGSQHSGIAYIVGKSLYPFSPKDFKVIDVFALSSKEKVPLNKRVSLFHTAVYELLLELKPNLCALETCFLGKNPQSALKLGMVRGAIISAIYRLNIPLYELAPTKIKKIVTGNGRAKKDEVALALKRLLNFDSTGVSYDASDALAIALSCGLEVGSGEQLFN